MSLDWDKVTSFAASLPGAERSTHYGGPAVKANGNAFVAPGREEGSFCLLYTSPSPRDGLLSRMPSSA